MQVRNLPLICCRCDTFMFKVMLWRAVRYLKLLSDSLYNNPFNNILIYSPYIVLGREHLSEHNKNGKHTIKKVKVGFGYCRIKY